MCSFHHRLLSIQQNKITLSMMRMTKDAFLRMVCTHSLGGIIPSLEMRIWLIESVLRMNIWCKSEALQFLKRGAGWLHYSLGRNIMFQICMCVSSLQCACVCVSVCVYLCIPSFVYASVNCSILQICTLPTELLKETVFLWWNGVTFLFYGVKEWRHCCSPSLLYYQHAK